MKKSVKQLSCTQTKFFNEAIATEDLTTPSIMKDIQNLASNIPSREDIVLTCSHCSTSIDDNIYKLKSWYNNDYFFVCEDCYNELKELTATDEDKYNQYIEARIQDKRLEEE